MGRGALNDRLSWKFAIYFNIRVFLLRSSVSVQVSTKIFGIISKWGGLGGVHYKHWGLKKKINKQVGCLFCAQE